MQKKLTKRTADALAAGSDRVYAWDTELAGFGLVVMPSGLKSFIVQYRTAGGRRGRTRKVTVGRYGPLTVDEARRQARAVLAAVAQGRDPATESADDKRAPTVAELEPAFLDDRRAHCKPATVKEYERQFKHDIRPALGAVRVADLTVKHVASLHLKMRKHRYSANRVLALLGAFCAWAERMGERPRHSNPCTDVKPYPEDAKERFLTPEEFKRLGDALRTAERIGVPPATNLRRKPKRPEKQKHRPKSAGDLHPANPYAVAAILFLILSGWRESEALSLRWDALDFKRRFATLGDTKTRRSVRALGAPALVLLSELKRLDGSPFVFPGAVPGTHLKEIKRVWYAVREAAKLPDVRIHDLRHSFASVTADAGKSLPLIGALLGHTRSDTTKRYAHLTEDVRVQAADEVAATIQSRLDGKEPTAKVISIDRKARAK